MKVNFDALEDFIHASKYSTVSQFFKESAVDMTSQNYYKLKRTSQKIKGHHLQTICQELGCRISDITEGSVLNEPQGTYKTLQVENELLRDLISEKDEIISLLREKLNKTVKKN
jgi:DNA-binding Xre family transcriptional regulator